MAGLDGLECQQLLFLYFIFHALWDVRDGPGKGGGDYEDDVLYSEGGREGEKEGAREGGREGVREGVREGGREGVKEGAREGGREGVREGVSE